MSIFFCLEKFIPGTLHLLSRPRTVEKGSILLSADKCHTHAGHNIVIIMHPSNFFTGMSMCSKSSENRMSQTYPVNRQ